MPVRTSSSRREVAALVAALATVALIGAAVPAAASETQSFEKPVGDTDYRPAFQITNESRWMNDPQRPFFLNGEWHYYYLYNEDYPGGNGTEWFHLTSTDLVHWTERGVAIHKYTVGDGDIETGSAVVDVNNTAGFGAGAVIAIMTQQLAGVQMQSLFYSLDGGYTFTPYAGNPVMPNPGVGAFRDPKVVWDEEHGQWVMVLAEHNKLSFFTSTDLKSWSYRSGFYRDDLGILECPDFFQMTVDGDPNRTTWVLATGANGYAHQMSTGTAYWTGSWDGTSFTTDGNDFRWMDSGSDFYAAVTWDDARLAEAERLASRYAIGWVNSWVYAEDIPTSDWAGGLDSVVRDVRLSDIGGVPTLTMTPVEALDGLEGIPTAVADTTVTASTPLPTPATGSYRLRATVSLDAANPADEVSFHLQESGENWTEVGYDFVRHEAFMRRDRDTEAPDKSWIYWQRRPTQIAPVNGEVTLDVLVDYSSVEVFVGGRAITGLVFPVPGARDISVVSTGGATRIRSLSITPMAVAQPTRLD